MFPFNLLNTIKFSELHASLDDNLSKQNYSKINEILYNYMRVYKQDLQLWLESQELEHHVPLYYFQVRQYYLDDFTENGEFSKDNLRKALIYAFRCLIISYMHIAESYILNEKFPIIEILVKKFDEKFYQVAKRPEFKEIFTQALHETEMYFYKILDDLPKTRIIPLSYWIYTCSAGGWSQPALNCPDLPNSEKRVVRAKFTSIPDIKRYRIAVTQVVKSLHEMRSFDQVKPFVSCL